MLYSIKTGDDGNMIKTKSTANYRPNWGRVFNPRQQQVWGMLLIVA